MQATDTICICIVSGLIKDRACIPIRSAPLSSRVNSRPSVPELCADAVRKSCLILNSSRFLKISHAEAPRLRLWISACILFMSLCSQRISSSFPTFGLAVTFRYMRIRVEIYLYLFIAGCKRQVPAEKSAIGLTKLGYIVHRKKSKHLARY